MIVLCVPSKREERHWSRRPFKAESWLTYSEIRSVSPLIAMLETQVPDAMIWSVGSELGENLRTVLPVSLCEEPAISPQTRKHRGMCRLGSGVSSHPHLKILNMAYEHLSQTSPLNHILESFSYHWEERGWEISQANHTWLPSPFHLFTSQSCF